MPCEARRDRTPSLVYDPGMPSTPAVPPPGSFPLKLVNFVTAAHVAVYKASGGRLGGTFILGSFRNATRVRVLLLAHIGRRTGRHRTTPLLYIEDGQDLVIIASRGGSDAQPAWWLNLQASPHTTVQVGSQRRLVVARQATPEEKLRLWPRVVDAYSGYADYQRRTKREIPVVILSPAAS